MLAVCDYEPPLFGLIAEDAPPRPSKRSSSGSGTSSSTSEPDEHQLAAERFADGLRVSSHRCEILGGYAYTKEFPAGRCYRDAKVTEICTGTGEIRRLVIARAAP